MKLGPGQKPIPADDLPNGWVASRIGDACSTVQGGRIGLTKGDNYRSSGFPAYSAAGQDGFVEVSEFAQEGVVLSAIGANCGRCFYANGQWTTLANVQAILPDTKKLSARFLFYRANMDGFWPRSGSAQPFIKPSDVHKCWVAHPREVAEQSRIAAVLDTVDEAIAKTEAVIAKLRQVRAGLLHDLLTRGLAQNGQLRDPIAHPEQFQDSPLGQIPKEWEIKQLGSLAQFITSGSRGWASFYSEEGALFLRIGNLTREHINLRLADIVRVRPPADSEGARTKVEPGDVLISVTADLGIIGVIPEPFEEAYVNQHIALVRPVRTVCPRWIGRYLSFGPAASFFRMLNDTGAKAGMNLPSIASLRVAIPNREEQDRAKEVLDSMDANIAQELLHQLKLQEIKSGLMNDLLTGHVRVPVEKGH